MAILATRRRCEGTSVCAAAGSSCCCQRLASMNSSSLVSIGNLRISVRYRDRKPSGVMTAREVVAIRQSPRGGAKAPGPIRDDEKKEVPPNQPQIWIVALEKSQSAIVS